MKMITALDKVYKEIDIQKDLWHPNIVPLLAVIDDAEEDSLYIIVEYMPGGAVMTWNEKKELYENGKFPISEYGGLPLSIIRAVAISCVRGLKYLHSLGIVHRVNQCYHPNKGFLTISFIVWSRTLSLTTCCLPCDLLLYPQTSTTPPQPKPIPLFFCLSPMILTCAYAISGPLPASSQAP